MGIYRDVAKFLLSAKEREVDFRTSLMLGNQAFALSQDDLNYLANLFSFNHLSTPTIIDSTKIRNATASERVETRTFCTLVRTRVSASIFQTVQFIIVGVLNRKTFLILKSF